MSKKNNIQNKEVTKYVLDKAMLELIYNPALSTEPIFAVFDKETQKVSYETEYKLENVVITPFTSNLITEKRIYLPSEAKEYNSEKKLLEVIERFIHRYLDLPQPFQYKLASHYILLTWIYDSFSVVPYLRAIGEPGSGKTRFAQVIGALCYKPLFLAGATSDAFIYRMNEIFKGTMIFNELERVNSDLSSTITVILNNGYEKGLFVGKVEGERNRVPMTFDVFSPKIITSRYPFRDIALESRIISILMRQTRRRDIAIMLDDYFWQQAQNIRDFLLMYRFKNIDISQPRIDESKWQSIEPRVRQTLIPLFSTIREENLKDEFIIFAKEYQEQINIDRGMESDALIAEKIVELLENNETVTVKDVADKVNEGVEDKERMTSRAVGKKIRRFGFKPKKVQGVYRINHDSGIIEILKERYSINQNYATNETPQSPPDVNNEPEGLVDIVDEVDITRD